MSPEDLRGRVPKVYQGIVLRALEGKGGRANAIRAKCLDCCAYQREMIRDCASVRCPLHPWRPYQTDPKDAPGEPES
jgi:hypothetical protein